MTKIQPLLQRGLTALDPWLDAVFPVATALICAKQRLAGYSLLVIYIALRLLQRSDKEPWRWILISLLVVNAGLIIEDRDLKPGGASDYLILALSFTAGMHRTRQQWNRNRKAIKDVLDEMIAGTTSEAAARVFLSGIGLAASSVDALITDAKDGQIDTPEVTQDAT